MLTEFLAINKGIADRRKAEAKAAAPDKPTNSDNGMALPMAAAPGETTDEIATLMQKFSTDTSFRAVVMGALQTLSEKSESALQIDEFCDKPGYMPLRILFDDALKDQPDDERPLKM